MIDKVEDYSHYSVEPSRALAETALNLVPVLIHPNEKERKLEDIKVRMSCHKLWLYLSLG